MHTGERIEIRDNVAEHYLDYFSENGCFLFYVRLPDIPITRSKQGGKEE